MTIAHQTLTNDFNTIPVVMVSPAEIQADPATFQFRRSSTNPDGVSAKARYQGAWNDAIHGNPLLVYEYSDGQKFVVDGHHRLEFAKRLKAHHSWSAPKFLAAQIIKEADGITPEHAKIIGAYRNIERLGENERPSGEKLLEAAEVLRSAMKEPGFALTLPPLPQNGSLLVAATAGTLGDEAFEIASKELPESIAVNIAAHTATRAMPETDKVQVLSVIANHLKPLKSQLVFS